MSANGLSVGDELAPLALPPLTRTTLALYAGASGDHNPLHIDIDYARAAGADDVIAHGMLSMAWLGRMLTLWVDQRRLREFSVRFSAIVRIGERITCRGNVAAILDHDGERVARVDVRAVNDAGEVKLSGNALIALR